MTEARRRTGGITWQSGALALAFLLPCAGLWWLLYTAFIPPSVFAEPDGRWAFAGGALAMALLLTLFLNVEAVAHERFVSPAFDPLRNFETARLRVNLRVLQNSVEQSMLFAGAIFGVAAVGGGDDQAVRIIAASTVVFIVSRWLFWFGYSRGSASRVIGMAAHAQNMILLLYVARQFGRMIGGPIGGYAPIVLVLLIELILVFWVKRPEVQL